MSIGESVLQMFADCESALVPPESAATQISKECMWGLGVFSGARLDLRSKGQDRTMSEPKEDIEVVIARLKAMMADEEAAGAGEATAPAVPVAEPEPEPPLLLTNPIITPPAPDMPPAPAMAEEWPDSFEFY